MPTVKNLKMENIAVIRNNMSSGEWGIPKFQRNEVWSIPQQVLFINSLLHGLPVGMIIIGLISTIKDVLDGRQRASTALKFLDDKLIYSDKRMKESDKSRLFPELIGKKFSEFPEDMKRRILKSAIAVQYVEFDSIKEANMSFYMLNTKGLNLNKGENIHSIFEGRTRTSLSNIAGWKFFTNYSSLREKRFGNLEFVVDLMQTKDKLPEFCADSKEIMSWAENHKTMSPRKIGEYSTVIKQVADDVNAIFSTEECNFWKRRSNLFSLMTAIMYLQHDGWKLESVEQKMALHKDLVEFSVKVAEPDNHDDYAAKLWAAKKNDASGSTSRRNLRQKILCDILKRHYSK